VNKIIFYKFKRIADNWYIVFLDENNNYQFINNDREALVAYFNNHKDCLFIGANNFKYDDILLSSLIKNHNLTDLVTEEDISDYLPRSLDITQGIVRNNLIDFTSIIYSIWHGDKALLNHYAIDEADTKKELIFDVEVIKSLYAIEERQRFLKWKEDIIKKYNLPKKAYHASFGRLMEYIIELDVDNVQKFQNGKKFTLDKKLAIELQSKNDAFLNDILSSLEQFYSSGEETNRPSITIGDCQIKLNEQGILGSKSEDYFDVDANHTYLYIDFNSFGPNILINNNWLADVSEHADRYSEIKNKRIELKNGKQLEQLFYKNILNAGLDDLTKVYTKDGYNIGLSLSVSGIMTMMLLYRNILKYDIELIECNTDGFIIKCAKSAVDDITNEVKLLEAKLNLSCDVDVIKKIVHFDEKNYIMEFEGGKIKHLGVFGTFQDNPLNYTGIMAVDEAIRNYYLYDIPVSVTLRKLRNTNKLMAFQIIKKQRSNEKPKYLKHNRNYVLCPCDVSRLFAVRKDKLKNTFYLESKKGKYEEYKVKRGRSIKDGFFYFEVCDNELVDINNIDLTYYIDKCYKVINAHPKDKNVNVNLNNKKKFGFIDLDGTLIKDMREEIKHQIFTQSVYNILDASEIDLAYDLFNQRNGNYVLQFLGLCKKYKGYGTIDNFAVFLMNKNLFPNVKDIEVYKLFITKYLLLEQEYASDIEIFNESKGTLEKLKSDGYELILYSNWFKSVQEAKLRTHNLYDYFNNLCTIDEYYAKSSIKGWTDILLSNNVQDEDLKIMLGNGSSDMVPKRLNIPSIIVNPSNRSLPDNVINNGIIISSLSEINDPYFNEEINKIKTMRLKKKYCLTNEQKQDNI